LVPHGVKDANDDDLTIKSWFAECYWASYGVAMNKLFVVDVDNKHDGLETWRALYSQPTRHCPHTWQVRTGGGGLHVFFQAHPHARNGKLERGIDLKARDSYIVGPCCKHVSGGVYRWDHQCTPGEAQLAEVPEWLLSLIRTRTYCGNVISMATHRQLARARALDGERHTTALKLIGHFVALGADEEMLREMMLGWNQGRCDPPLSDADILNMIGRIYERERIKHSWLAVPAGVTVDG
jgi:putative DNA primase/helicase